jgi:valyl-tRNA synthetase
VEGYRHFANKLWNAARFALMNMTGYDADRFGDALRGDSESHRLTRVDKWILSRLQRTSIEVDEALETFRFNDAANGLYRFVWSDLCDWYIEMAKPALYDQTNEVVVQQRKRAAQGCLATAIETACRLLHPFMPYVTEEIWQQLPKPTGTPGSIMITMYPVADTRLVDERTEREVELMRDVITAVRNLRAEYNVPPGKLLDVTVLASSEARAILSEEAHLVRALGRVGELTLRDSGAAPAGTVSSPIRSAMGGLEVCVHLAGTIDVQAERARLDKDVAKTRKEREGVAGRLGNDSFVARAPADVVEKERLRLAELDEKLGRLQQSIARLQQI